MLGRQVLIGQQALSNMYVEAVIELVVVTEDNLLLIIIDFQIDKLDVFCSIGSPYVIPCDLNAITREI